MIKAPAVAVLIFFTTLVFIRCQSASDQAEDFFRPNIVIILADDFGVGDIQAHYPGNKIRTPFLDQLVGEGMSFTDAHSGSAVCTPTRYGLLTGRYCWRTPLQEWVLACYEPPLIKATDLTLPAFLGQQGYQTACIGKWHLGWNWPGENESRMIEEPNGLKNEHWYFDRPIPGGPNTRGFDYYFGTHVPNFPPFTFTENDRIVQQPTEKYQYDPTEGVVMPKTFDGAPIAPGWRFDQILPTITQQAVQYIHEQAGKDDPFLLYFSMTSPHEPVVPSDAFDGKSGIAPIADFVMETDWSVGQIMQALTESDMADNTLLIFTADNGHSGYTGWEDLLAAGHHPSGPFRGHKADIWEGGHRVPFIARWPRYVAAGSSNNQLLCLNDIFATCADLLKKPLPNNAAADSHSFLAALQSRKDSASRPGIVHHSVHGEFSYRQGPWKLVFQMPTSQRSTSRGKETIVSLYNLDADQTETTDVADAYPNVVSKLTAALDTIVNNGRSTPGARLQNDVPVDFRTVQERRWMAGDPQ
ncbi:MAG: arylsulfatase [Saprospiraceae bacterium]|nr:arylsulfatase [Saprospiraceae bacterium]